MRSRPNFIQSVRLLLFLLLLSAADGSTGNNSNTNLLAHNETYLDCQMRSLAWNFARKLVAHHGNRNMEMPVQIWVHDALRLKDLCALSMETDKKEMELDSNYSANLRIMNAPSSLEQPKISRQLLRSKDFLKATCRGKDSCVHVASTAEQNTRDGYIMLGTLEAPFVSIHDAIDHIRASRRTKKSKHPVTILLHPGIHFVGGRPLTLHHELDNFISIVGIPKYNDSEDDPEPQAWLSGAISLSGIDFQEDISRPGVYVGNISSVLHSVLQESSEQTLPPLLSLFTSRTRYIRARYPNANPETAQWGYASFDRNEYSIPREAVLEWHTPPAGPIPDFTFVDFQENPPPGIPIKNNSAQRGYNWYASGKGGVCADVWGPEADSYWCSNASQGGWAEVDQEAATSGKMQLPIGLTYNTSSVLKRFVDSNLEGGIIHAWHSQSWAMHMFEITHHYPSTGVFHLAKGGGKQGGRNWCRCDQCTYAWSSCGQHQTPPWEDTRLISGRWMIENVLDELDSPGEYFFDRKTKLLYVFPNSTDDLLDFRIAVSKTLLNASKVFNLTISNVGFRDTVPTYHPDFDWSAPSGGDWSLHRGGALFLENVTNVSISDCIFRRLDGNAVFLSRRTRNVTIERSLFEWLGENAIALWGDTKGYDATAEDFPMHTTIDANIMRELGLFEKQSSAVGIAKAALTSITNNIMFNMPRAAINFNDMVGGGDEITGNLIFNTCRESGDHGPINSWDRQPYLTTLRDGTTPSFDPIPRLIEANYIIANYGASQGVDNDDGSSWFYIRRNLFYSAEGFKMDYGGHDSIFEENLVMAFPYDGAQCFGLGGFLPGHGHTYRKNRCLVGLGRRMDSGCGDPSCARQDPEPDASQEIVGHLWGGCNASIVNFSDNEYYTPDGKARIECAQTIISLREVQDNFGIEKGSSTAALPDDDTIFQWAKALLP